MQSENKIFDDLAKMMNGVAGTMAGMGREQGDRQLAPVGEWLVEDRREGNPEHGVKRRPRHPERPARRLEARLDQPVIPWVAEAAVGQRAHHEAGTDDHRNRDQRLFP
jgi:hypothetical protein